MIVDVTWLAIKRRAVGSTRTLEIRCVDGWRIELETTGLHILSVHDPRGTLTPPRWWRGSFVAAPVLVAWINAHGGAASEGALAVSTPPAPAAPPPPPPTYQTSGDDSEARFALIELYDTPKVRG